MTQMTLPQFQALRYNSMNIIRDRKALSQSKRQYKELSLITSLLDTLEKLADCPR